jgi:hypothetical protein
MPFFQKLPVTIEAREHTGDSISAAKIVDWVTDCGHKASWCLDENSGSLCGMLTIETLEGTHLVSPGDWVIKGVRGEFYPCKPEIFAEIYKQV